MLASQILLNLLVPELIHSLIVTWASLRSPGLSQTLQSGILEVLCPAGPIELPPVSLL